MGPKRRLPSAQSPWMFEARSMFRSLGCRLLRHLPLMLLLAGRGQAAEPLPGPDGGVVESADLKHFQSFIQTHCLACHDASTRQGDLSLEDALTANVAQSAPQWERVWRQLASRQMPPPSETRPQENDYVRAVAFLENSLEAASTAAPNPGRTETFRRLNRTQYANAVRDLLQVNVDAKSLLPPDPISSGFDNITVSDLSPALLNRYLSSAGKIARMATGLVPPEPEGVAYRVRPDVTQDVPIEGLPQGTRGGTLIQHHFAVPGEYEVQIRLMRDRNEDIEGLQGTHELELLVDRQRVASFVIQPAEDNAANQRADANLKARFHVDAGPHKVGVAFLKLNSNLQETLRQPLHVHFNYYRHPRLGPAVYEVSIVGPLEVDKPADKLADAEEIKLPFDCNAKTSDEELACAERMLGALALRAYRRPVDEKDLALLMSFFRKGRAEGSFRHGMSRAIEALLVNPRFLFHIQLDPSQENSGNPRPISDWELISRLSFFLWSSLPDDELLDLASQGRLRDSGVLDQQIVRMMNDERSQSLVKHFASQWLYLGNLDALTPDMRLFPDFDDNLRQAMRRETELFAKDVFFHDVSVFQFIRSDYTYLNERLAKHYGIPHVYGNHFRRVQLEPGSHRGGLLRQASILAVTSYATRTSPVIRGHWVLQNMLGLAPPPPPPSVPALQENSVSSQLSVRERLLRHSVDTSCSLCHRNMDPIGFALENYDALGRWRTHDAGRPIESHGVFVDGASFKDVDELENALLLRGDLFAHTLTEKLLTFALGRKLESYDGPAVRKIVREAKAQDYRFSAFVRAIVHSTPFQWRMSP